MAQLPTADCRVREVLDHVAGKWTLAVVNELGDGPRRFMELMRAIHGISRRMLTATLRDLERDGLLTRTVYPVVPPRVEYELTPLGHSLLSVSWRLIDWAQEHRVDIDEARDAYDAAAPAPGEPAPREHREPRAPAAPVR